MHALFSMLVIYWINVHVCVCNICKSDLICSNKNRLVMKLNNTRPNWYLKVKVVYMAGSVHDCWTTRNKTTRTKVVRLKIVTPQHLKESPFAKTNPNYCWNFKWSIMVLKLPLRFFINIGIIIFCNFVFKL